MRKYCEVTISKKTQFDYSYTYFQTISKYGVLDILVSNAAVNPAVGPVTDCPEAVWDKIFDVNVKSTFLLMKEAVPFLKKSKSPSIIIISSIAAFQPLSVSIRMFDQLHRLFYFY